MHVVLTREGRLPFRSFWKGDWICFRRSGTSNQKVVPVPEPSGWRTGGKVERQPIIPSIITASSWHSLRPSPVPCISKKGKGGEMRWDDGCVGYENKRNASDYMERSAIRLSSRTKFGVERTEKLLLSLRSHSTATRPNPNQNNHRHTDIDIDT